MGHAAVLAVEHLLRGEVPPNCINPQAVPAFERRLRLAAQARSAISGPDWPAPESAYQAVDHHFRRQRGEQQAHQLIPALPNCLETFKLPTDPMFVHKVRDIVSRNRAGPFNCRS